MSNVNTGQMSFQLEEVELNFRFQVNGTTHPDNVVGGGRAIEDITYVSAGLFDITLREGNAFVTLISCFVDPEDVADIGKYVSWTFATRKLRVTTLLADGSPAAADPTDDTWVHVRAVFCRRSELAPTLPV